MNEAVEHGEEKIVSEQYVIFTVDDENYGLDIKSVNTVERPITTTRVPRTPDFLKGVVNLRGDVIPVIDLRKKFKLPDVEETDDTRIIILKVDGILVGIIVDFVEEVVNLAENEIESAEEFDTGLSREYVDGIGRHEERIITILNLQKLIDISEES